MAEVLMAFEEWRLGLLDVAFLITVLAVLAFFILDYLKRRRDLGKRHKAILGYLDKKGKINTSSASRLLKASGDTALRELSRMVEMGVLERKGHGRGACYAKR